MSRQPKKQVYVSSTFSDLEKHRATLKITLEKAGYEVECMEKYPAFDERPADKCLVDVAECDYYVLLVALRYGHQPDDNNPRTLSITEMEYEQAINTKRPCLPFLLDVDDDDFGWPPKRCDDGWQSNDSSIGRFRARIGAAHGRSLFTTPDNLAKVVQEALHRRETAALPKAARAQAEIRDAYLSWLLRECASVELLGLDVKESQNVRLGQVYVPAVTEARDERAKAEPEPELGDRKAPRMLLDALGEGSLYVPGAPGAGKSTFCRWLAFVVAAGELPPNAIPAPEGFIETLPATLRGRLPILCRLREWAGYRELLAGAGKWTRAELEASLAGWVARSKPGGLSPELFKDELDAGRCLLIFDGVDEVPERLEGHYPRMNLLSGLADALPDWHKAGNVLILTSRPYGLDAADRRRLGLPDAGLAELPDELQDVFVRRWYAAADPLRAVEKAEGLLTHLVEREDLVELRRNPMLLTALCVKYDEGQRLPQDFYTLYDAVVSQVLHKRYPTENERERVRNRLAAIALGMHRGETTRLRATPEAEITLEEVDRHLARLAETDLTTEAGAGAAADLREDLLSGSGLLLPRADKRAAFYHLSFQEFLAAVRLRRLGESPKAVLRDHAGTRAWHRTLRFLFCAIADRDSPEVAMEAYRSLLPELEPAGLDRDPSRGLLLADCLEVVHARGWNADAFVAPLRRACEHALADLQPPERARFWLTLGRLGLDERPGVGLRDDGLPDIAWEHCEAGDFLFGDPSERRTLAMPFRIARYPVTHRQFQAFVDAGGYEQDKWWAGLAQGPEPTSARWSEPNAPRETVSWYEATAFCRWLDVQLRAAGALPEGWQVSLPTEEQWERAARGTDGRPFPWEGDDYRSGFANIDETWKEEGVFNLGRTSPVGIYPAGEAPSGALDMAGNVWEWCRNEHEKPERIADEGDSPRVVRGGSWINGSDGCRAAGRSRSVPDNRHYGLGFRVCCAPPIA